MQENITCLSSSHVPVHEVLEEMSEYVKKQGFFFIYLQHTPLHPVILHACRKLCVIYTVFTFLRICSLFMQ